MNISSVSGLSAANSGLYSELYSGYGSSFTAFIGSGPTSRSVITQADGATVTTTRGLQNDVVAVTTVQPVRGSAAAYDSVPQNTESTVDVTA